MLRHRIRQNIEQRSQYLDTLAHRLLHPAQTLAQQREHLLNLQRRLDSGLRENSAHGRNQLANLSRRLILARPDTTLQTRRLEAVASKLRSQWLNHLNHKNGDIARLTASLTHLNPEAVLARGYSIVTDAAGTILRDCHTLEPNDLIAVNFHRGRVEAKVSSTCQYKNRPPR